MPLIARYPALSVDADWRASEQECLDRAQRALEVAECCLETFTELINNPDNRSLVTFADLLNHARQRIALSAAWATLADNKHEYAVRHGRAAPHQGEQ